MLSCNCDFDKDDFEEWYYYPTDFSKLRALKRKRCKSCNKLIDINSTVIEFDRYRHPNHDIEWRCKGGEIPLASYFMCEKCGEQFLNLTALGFCVDINENMFDCLKEYQKITGFKNN